MLDKAEMDQLNKGWTTIMIIWFTLLASLGVYLAVCKNLETEHISSFPEANLPTVKLVLYGISLIVFIVAYFMRKHLMNLSKKNAMPGIARASLFQSGHPAVGRYLTVIIVAMALSESIGIYGLVLFLLGKDMMALYQLIALSAIAMVVFGPRKHELIDLATVLKKTEMRGQMTK